MSLIEKIRNKPEKTRNLIVAGISGFFVLVIAIVGWFVYEAPYKKNIRNEYSLVKTHYFKGFFLNAKKDADSFVEPVDEFFTQQNQDLSSENQFKKWYNRRILIILIFSHGKENK